MTLLGSLVLPLLLLPIAIISAISVKRITDGRLRQLNLQIQGYSPSESDDYVAVGIKAEPGYIVKFEPFASAERVHHMLLYGCSQPAGTGFWRGGATCNGASHILWAWARNAPSFVLPEDVAFQIGHPSDPIQHLVLQIHYAKLFDGKVRDFSGVALHISDKRPKYLAAVYLFVSGNPIPPRMDSFLSNMSCTYESDIELHPFAFRTHTHAMGRVVSAYVKHTSNGKWEQIGKRNPQWPQLFQTAAPVVIKKGDFLAATCRFYSHDKNDYTPMGSMGMNEMCNFYMMFYRDANADDPFPYGAGCFGGGDPGLMAREYPLEGTTLLPSHPELEHMAHQSARPFGIVEKGKFAMIGDQKLGQVAGLAFDPAGNLVIFHRADRTWSYTTFDVNNVFTNNNDRTPIQAPTVLVASSGAESKTLQLQGKYGRAMFYLPHGIFVDENNDYYTTDVGSHQVIKWRIEKGELTRVWEFGEKLVPGSDQGHLCKPAGVVASRTTGDVFIADGYCNNRVVKLTKEGVYSAQWGHQSHYGREVGKLALGFFSLPHDVTIDEDGQLIYVADRENGRVQIFNTQGDPQYEIQHSTLYSTVYSAHFCPAHGLFFIPGTANSESGDEIQAYAVPLNSTKIQYSFRPTSDLFKRPHIIRARDEDIWVGEIDERGGVLWRFQIQTEDLNHTIPLMMQHHSGGHGMDRLPTASSAGGGGDDGFPISYSSDYSDSTMILVLNLALLVFVLGVSYFSVRYCCRRMCGPKSRSSQYTIDRTGFKLLKTTEFESSEDESGEDLVVAPSLLKSAEERRNNGAVY